MAAKDQVGDQDVNINKFAGISDYQDNKQPGPLHPRRIVGCMHEALGNVDLLLIQSLDSISLLMVIHIQYQHLDSL